MICNGCNKQFDLNEGAFAEGQKIPGFTGSCWDWYCATCTVKVPIDATTKKDPKPAPAVGTASVGEPDNTEQIPVEAYDDSPF